ncbi:inhibitor of KinA [Belliella buryatensis]|uniref:Inhibitor of KinA n=1 Tax=Belliella buryatensis TaxID=1500549 RepID=A0A239ESW2_9BACT|nr:5-oxoprolinase subunit PxpB [Belliella buryatensis]SNS46972.1 inhibitor of KinA [Belliella buryatensis]
MEKKIIFIQPDLVEIQWPNQINDSILEEQLLWKAYLQANYQASVYEIRLGYHVLSVLFSKPIDNIEFESILSRLKKLKKENVVNQVKTWSIPVCYEIEFAKDLELFANIKNLSIEKVIQLHTTSFYRLHFYGFLPGFMYLGGLTEELYQPRKSSPDPLIKAGSVAIGGQQTGIYPTDSPGGWYVIGKTPLRIFDINQTCPVVPQQGDFIQFFDISKTEYLRIENEVQLGNYNWSHA